MAAEKSDEEFLTVQQGAKFSLFWCLDAFLLPQER